MGDPIEHTLDDLIDRGGWDHGVCACGWETPGCPGPIEAANFWGQHLLAEVMDRG